MIDKMSWIMFILQILSNAEMQPETRPDPVSTRSIRSEELKQRFTQLPDVFVPIAG